MKAVRAAFFASLALLPLAGLVTGARILYLLAAFEAFLLVVSAALGLWAILTFTFQQAVSAESTERGRPVRLALRVLNEKPFPYALLRLRLSTADPCEDRRVDLNLPPRSERSFDLVLECPHRGLYPIGITVIDFVDLFGLLRLPFDLRLLSWYRAPQLLVLPRAPDLPRLPLRTLDSKAAARRAAPSEDPLEPFSDLRAYRPGDSRRLIHWKASLRQRALLSRRFDPVEEPRLRILVDLAPPGGGREEAAQAEDALCEAAAAVLRHLLRQNRPVEVAAYGRTPVRFAARGPKDFPALRRWLATAAFDAPTPLDAQVAQETASLREARAFLVLTARPDGAGLAALRAIRDRLSVHALVAGPAQDDGRTREAAADLRRAGIPAWALRYGEDPADVLGAEP